MKILLYYTALLMFIMRLVCVCVSLSLFVTFLSFSLSLFSTSFFLLSFWKLICNLIFTDNGDSLLVHGDGTPPTFDGYVLLEMHIHVHVMIVIPIFFTSFSSFSR